jgi:pseudouridine synthase
MPEPRERSGSRTDGAPSQRGSPPPITAEGERLQRVLARAGLGSRRSVEELIADGRVRVNGRVAELGNRVDPATDSITLDGIPVPTRPDLRTFALNKPRGVTSTLKDRHAERTVAELIPAGERGVVPVGRLDRDSEGLLLLTNDGDLAHRLQHPRFGVEKEYLVEVEGRPATRTLNRLIRGIDLEDGLARAKSARLAETRGDRSALALVMGEGRKREIRRMLAAVEHPVTRLVRVRIGPIRLGRLRPGEVRPLAVEEVIELYRVTGRTGSKRPARPP